MKNASIKIALVLAVSASACASPPATTFEEGDEDDVVLAESLSVKHLATELSLGDRRIAPEDVRVRVTNIDDLGMAHTRFQQTFRGVPVFGGEAIVHLDRSGAPFALTDALVPAVQLNASEVPTLSERNAVRAAIEAYGCEDCLTDVPSTDLWIFRHEGRDHLAYRVQLRREDGSPETALPIIFVDAHSGLPIFRYDNLQTGTGNGLYNGTVPFTTLLRNGNYHLEDTTRRVGTFDNRNLGTTTTYRYTDVNDVWDTAAQAEGVDVMFGMSKFIDYMMQVHNRNGIDGNGGPTLYTSVTGTTPLLSAKARYGTNYDNAFWNGSFIALGSGDGVMNGPWGSLDMVGHELMHGVTQYTAGLVYSYESGALNEAYSDIFGALLERWVRGPTAGTWLIGEEFWTPNIAGDTLRSLRDPHDSQNYNYTSNDNPDHYSERYVGANDAGGVHINSGIPAKAFFLLVEGGSHHLGGSMAGIGADMAGRIWYRALTQFMTSSTNFAAARVATLNAAAALYGAGSTQHTAVATSWTLCGVN